MNVTTGEVSLTIGDAFGHHNTRRCNSSDSWKVRERRDLINELNQRAWFPILSGQIGGYKRIELAFNAPKTATLGYKVALCVRGFFEIIGAGLLFKPADWVANYVRNCSQPIRAMTDDKEMTDDEGMSTDNGGSKDGFGYGMNDKAWQKV